MSQHAAGTATVERRLLVVPALREGALRERPLPAWLRSTRAGDPDRSGPGADRLARREALLHLLELDRQRRRYRSA